MEPPINHDRPYTVTTCPSPSLTNPDRCQYQLNAPGHIIVSRTTGGDGGFAYQAMILCNDAYEAGIAEGARRAAEGQQKAREAAQ